MMDVLRQATKDEQAARQASASIHTYTLGLAALEAARASWTPPADDVDELARQLATYTSQRQFDEGLTYLLDGMGTPEQATAAVGIPCWLPARRLWGSSRGAS